jgi:methyl-accepting chemotaxis protein
MNDTQGMRISVKLGLAFSSLVLFLVITVAVALNGLSTVNSSLLNITQVNNVEAKMANELLESVQEIRVAYRTVIIVTSQTEINAAMAKYNDVKATYLAREKQLADQFQAQTGTSQQERDLIGQIQALRPNALSLVEKATQLGALNKNDEAKDVMLTQANPAMNKVLETIRSLAELENRNAANAAIQAQQTYSSVRAVMVGLAILAIVLALAIALLITRNVLKTLGGEPHYVAGVMRELAAGNLMVSIQTRPGDSSSLAAAIALMVDKLRSIITEVKSGADNLSSAAQQLSATSQALAQGASESASGVEETSSSIEEIT